MITKRLAIGLAAALFAMGFVLSSTASAQGPGRQGLGRATGSLARSGRAVRAVTPKPNRALGRAVGRNVGRTVASQPRGTLPRLAPNRSTASRPHSASHLGSGGGRGGYDLADAINSLGRYLGQYPQDNRSYNGYGGYPNGYGGSPYGYGGYPYGRDQGYYDNDAYADAYRDAAIANAVVGVVGIIANSQAARVAQPTGYYERRQVVVKPGYYEDVQVWVPDYQDPNTGDIVSGHYEVRRRWVPEVYGYQDVRVGPPATVVAPAPGAVMVTPVPPPMGAPGPRPIYFRR